MNAEQGFYINTLTEVLQRISPKDSALTDHTNLRFLLVRELHVTQDNIRSAEIGSPFEQMCRNIAQEHLDKINPDSLAAQTVIREGLDASIPVHRVFAFELLRADRRISLFDEIAGITHQK